MRRTGTLLEERFRSFVIEADSCLLASQRWGVFERER
jgi:hypothetical protein